MTYYPIINDVPRILPHDLLSKLVKDYDKILHKYKISGLTHSTIPVHSTDVKIAKGFEFEWKKHSKLLAEHEKEFIHVLGDVITVDEIKDKLLSMKNKKGKDKYESDEVLYYAGDFFENLLNIKQNIEKFEKWVAQDE